EVGRYVAERVKAHGADALDPHAYVLPLTVESAVQSRLDHLDRADKDLIKRASVFGERFWREALGDLGCADPTTSLTRLGRSGVVRRPSRRDTQLAELEEYTFRQRVVRDVAYLMLTDEQKKALHLNAGRWLARVPSARPEIAAAHLDDGGDHLAAAPLWAQAAEQAEQEGDIAAAYQRWKFVLSAGGASSTGIHRAKLSAARAAYFLGRPAECHVLAQELHGSGGRDDVEVLYWLGITYAVSGSAGASSLRDGAAALRRAIETGEPGEIRVRALSSLANTCNRLEVGTGREYALRAVEESKRFPSAGPHAWDAVSMCELAEGRFSEAKVACTTGLGIAIACGNIGFEVGLRADLAYILSRMGQLDLAEAGLRGVIDLSGRVGRGAEEAYARHNLGMVLFNREQFSEAADAEDRALAWSLGSGDNALRAYVQAYRALMLPLVGRTAEALAAADDAIVLSAGTPHERECMVVRGFALLRAGSPGDALASIQDANDGDGGMFEFLSESYLTRAEALRDLGRLDECRQVAGEGLEAVRLAGNRVTASDEELGTFVSATWARRQLATLA
ncbi:MAG: tetratricopeptide (TPR) repeat protein, partial [Myxococcota bacterium]